MWHWREQCEELLSKSARALLLQKNYTKNGMVSEDKLKRMISLFISLLMFLAIIPTLTVALFHISSFEASLETVRLWPFAAVGIIGSFPFIFGGSYFLAYAVGQNPEYSKWLEQLPIILLGMLCFVGVFVIMETSLLSLFPQSPVEIRLLLYPVAVIIFALIIRLIKHENDNRKQKH
jgi:hypothetical protein